MAEGSDHLAVLVHPAVVFTATLAPLRGSPRPAACALRAASFNEISRRAYQPISSAIAGSVAMIFLPSSAVMLRSPRGVLVGQMLAQLPPRRARCQIARAGAGRVRRFVSYQLR